MPTIALPGRLDAVMPSESDIDLAAQASRALAGRTQEGNLRVRLDDGQEVLLPRGATRLLTHLLTEMGQGSAVTLIPVHAELTTQQAADLLNVSRPYLIQLLEKRAIPYHKTGTHRRIKFDDLMRYKKGFDAESEGYKEALINQAQDMGMGY
ncbi:MAG: helix-turn-helix domain-containing protein [Rhodospirillales bacterium]|nr:helix-turn-helix domain-containing protein [Rhodospirillales bacterium]